METSSHIPVFLSLQKNLTLALGIGTFAFACPLHSSNSLNISNSQKLHPKALRFLYIYRALPNQTRKIVTKVLKSKKIQ